MTIITNIQGKMWLAVKARLQAWTECKVMMPNEAYQPTAKTIYIIAQNIATEYGGRLPVKVDCGQPITGVLNLSVLVPTDYGYDAHIGLAGRIADHFSNGLRMTYQDATVEVSGRALVQGTPALQAPWNRIEVQVPIRAWG